MTRDVGSGLLRVSHPTSPDTGVSGPGWGFPDVTPVLERLGERPPTTQEMRQYALQLVERYPDLCKLQQVGTTRRGTPLEVLVVYADTPAAPAALVYAQVHANEPWATGTAKALMDYVTTEPAARQRTWAVLLGLDPDAAMRAEGWAAFTPLSIENAIRTFYRPHGDEQPEWSFAEDSPMLEVQALMKVIREYRPDLIFSLHNCNTAFPTVSVTDDVPGMEQVVARAAAESTFTNFKDIGDFIGLKKLKEGVFKQSADSPWERIADYASRQRSDRANILVLEGPMWRGHARVHTIEEAADVAEKHGAVLAVLFERLPSIPTSDLYRSTTLFVERSEKAAKDYRTNVNWRIPTTATADDPAPITISPEIAYMIPLRGAGMMWRFVNELLVTDPANPVLDQVERELDKLITQWCREYERAFSIAPAHLADTVGYQLKVILATTLLRR